MGDNSFDTKPPQIFGLSSYVDKKLVQKAKAIGFVYCIQAPLNKDTALKILHHHVEEKLRIEMEHMLAAQEMSQSSQSEGELLMSEEKKIHNPKKRVNFMPNHEKSNSLEEDDR